MNPKPKKNIEVSENFIFAKKKFISTASLLYFGPDNHLSFLTGNIFKLHRPFHIQQCKISSNNLKELCFT